MLKRSKMMFYVLFTSIREENTGSIKVALVPAILTLIKLEYHTSSFKLDSEGGGGINLL
jgi:hypothetical protein